jgi:hypothetical protein
MTDVASHPTNEELVPSPGDMNICLNCGQLSVFTDGLNLRPTTDKDMAGMSEETKELLERTLAARAGSVTRDLREGSEWKA